MARKILPEPKYVISVYSYEEKLRGYEAQIRRLKNKRQQEKAERGSEPSPFFLYMSLDELPQAWDIFRREMLLIGPRPALWNQNDLVAERGNTAVGMERKYNVK